jgi:hypothetical protein
MPRIVVSLTTSPTRMLQIQPVLDSIFAQKLPPDQLYLHLPERWRDSETYAIPDELRNESRLTLCPYTKPDPGPVLKLLPTLELETDPDTIIITIDDDVAYPPNLIHAYHAASEAAPEAAFGSRGFSFDSSTGTIQPVRSQRTSCDVLQGYGACAYRRHHFDHEALATQLVTLPHDFRFSDDLLLSNHLAQQQVPRYTLDIAAPLDHLPWGDHDPAGLKHFDGGTHRRYLAIRTELREKGAWFLR